MDLSLKFFLNEMDNIIAFIDMDFLGCLDESLRGGFRNMGPAPVFRLHRWQLVPRAAALSPRSHSLVRRVKNKSNIFCVLLIAQLHFIGPMCLFKMHQSNGSMGHVCFSIEQVEWGQEKKRMPVVSSTGDPLAVRSLASLTCWQERQKMTSS